MNKINTITKGRERPLLRQLKQEANKSSSSGPDRSHTKTNLTGWERPMDFSNKRQVADPGSQAHPMNGYAVLGGFSGTT